MDIVPVFEGYYSTNCGLFIYTLILLNLNCTDLIYSYAMQHVKLFTVHFQSICALKHLRHTHIFTPPKTNTCYDNKVNTTNTEDNYRYWISNQKQQNIMVMLHIYNFNGMSFSLLQSFSWFLLVDLFYNTNSLFISAVLCCAVQCCALLCFA